MPKRKLEEGPSTEASDPSPPPAGLLDTNGPREVVNGDGNDPSTKRRKTQQIKSESSTVGIVDLTGGDETASTRVSKKVSRKRELNGKAEHFEEAIQVAKKKVQRKKPAPKGDNPEVDGNGDEAAKAVIKKPRRSKAQKEAELVEMPLASRTAAHKLFIGAHVSSSGGVHNSILNSVHIGANAFALFLKSQRKWTNPALSSEHATSFLANCKKHAYDSTQHVVPHGSYLVNLAHTDPARTEQAYTTFLDDLQRCERLNIKLYNFHPGNTASQDRATAIAHLASNLNRAHAATSTVVTLLENMAAGGNVLGSTFEDLRDTIALVADKSRVGVCLDTCHAFAAGYDLRSPSAFKATLAEFDDVVGMQYLRALHLNDSKAPFKSHRDLHANIGTGFLGLLAFHSVVNEPRFEGLPMVLETPITACDDEGLAIKDEKGKEKEDKRIWSREIKLLESMVGMDVDGEEFKTLGKALARRGETERKRLMEQFERKVAKEEKKAKSPGKKRKSKVAAEPEDESSLSELEEGADGEE